jgi:RNA-directed DNA polymerase
MVESEAAKRKISYTRYADDLTFSGQRIGMLKDMIKTVQKSIHEIESPRLTINVEKTTFITPAQRRIVTGVTLANNGTLSLGRDRKRLISAQVHHADLGKLSPREMGLLAGQLAFVNVVEPAFLDRLKDRYGSEVINRIQHSVFIPE